jgi:hypothetical protein
MIGFVVVVGIVFYGVLYSGLRDLSSDPISTLDALRGKMTTTKPPASTHGTTVGTTGYSGGGGPGGAKKP